MTRIGAAVGAAILTVGLGAAALSVAAPDQGAGRRGGPGRFDDGGPGRMGRGGPMGPLAGLPLRELNLTDAQREQVRAVVDSREADTRAIGERAIAAREALHAAVTSPTFDEGLVRAKAAELSAIEADLAVVRARILADVFQLLTLDQQAKVKELSGSRPPRPNGRH